MKREGLDLSNVLRWLYDAVRRSISAVERLAAAGELGWMTGGIMEEMLEENTKD